MRGGLDAWRRGFEIVRKDGLMWMLAACLVMILNVLPGVGIVSLFHMAQKAKRSEKISIGDAMFGLSKLVPALTAGIIFLIPFLLFLVPGLYYGPQMIYAFSLIASGKETDGTAAIRKSMELVKNSGGVGGHFARWLLLMILGGSGSVACFIGMYFTFPCAIVGLDDIVDDMEGAGE